MGNCKTQYRLLKITQCVQSYLPMLRVLQSLKNIMECENRNDTIKRKGKTMEY